MEEILRGKKPAEIIPFDLSASIVYYPIRHHSPVCAWHLESVLERYAPDCILIEGPENANDLLPLLADPDTKAPVALYYAYRDDAKLLSDDDEPQTFRCYYPFLDTSPELVAIRHGLGNDIRTIFMDLPYGNILLATKEAAGLRTNEEKLSYASDRYIASSRFQQILCEKAQVRDFEEFWEKYFETEGFSLSDEAFVNIMNTYCLLARQDTPGEALLEDGCIARESHMARRIQEAQNEFSRILVVAGGFHIYGLLHAMEEGQLKKIPESSQFVYPMRYTMPASDALSGYASGMPMPGFYDEIWKVIHEAGTENAWEQVLLDHIVKTGRQIRKKGGVLSAFDETCAMEQAIGLAQLRQKRHPGLYELQDAVLSCFVKGEASLSNVEPLRILRQITAGKTVGQLAKGAKVPPLTADFDAQCRRHRLKLEVGSQEATLSIFSEPKHREASRFFHRAAFLDCGFAKRKKGPDPVARKDRNLIRETWEYRWTASVDAALIEHAVSGGTVYEACITELRAAMGSASRASEGAALLVKAFLMGIPDSGHAFFDRLELLLASDGDFVSLCDAANHMHTLILWQERYGESGKVDSEGLLRRCFDKLLRLLPAMHSVDERTSPRIQGACRTIFQLTEAECFAQHRKQLLQAFETLADANPIQPGLHGCILGLLYGADPDWKSKIDTVVRGYLMGTEGMMLKSADFLQGLFYTARDLLLTDQDFLKMIDLLLCRLTDEDFTRLLPQLRLAFSYFVPTETDHLARSAAKLHGASAGELRRTAVSAADYTRAETLDSWAAKLLDTIGGDIHDD